MMLLGVLLHASQFYMTAAGEDPNFLFQDSRPSAACDSILFGIHSFRMQVFFVMSGFFAALLYDRRGLDGMTRNRFHRVVLPLVVGWLVLFPPTMTAMLCGMAQRAGYPPGQAVLTWWTSGRFAWTEDGSLGANLFFVGPLHLWFLYLLCLFYAAAMIAVLLGKVGRGAVGRAVNWLYRALWTTRLILPASIALSYATLMLHPAGMFSQEFPLFLPNPLAMLGFGPFFAFGWLLHRNPEYLDRFRRWPVATLAVAAVLIVVYLRQLGTFFEGVEGAKTWVAATGAAIPWLCTFGFIGLFQRYFGRPSATMRYLSDSAYWVYLAHLPLVYGLQAAMFAVPLPGVVKMVIVLMVAVPLLLASYELFVRSTILGQWLNGRRHPRAWLLPPGRHESGTPIAEPVGREAEAQAVGSPQPS